MMTLDGPSVTERYATRARQHPGLVLTEFYLAATAVGMLSSWTFYSHFGINVFQYAQVSDFILVSFRNPLATLAILAAVPVVWLIIKTDDLLDRHLRWYKYTYGLGKLRALSRTPAARALYMALYAYVFSVFYSGHLAAQMKAGEVRAVEAQLQSGQYLGQDATQPFRTSVLGMTTDYLFLYDVGSGAVTIVPVENLARLTLE